MKIEGKINYLKDARAKSLQLKPRPRKAVPAHARLVLGKPASDMDIVQWERINNSLKWAAR